MTERRCSLFAVCGRPIAHSLSPQLFRAAFRKLGLPHLYLRLAAQSAGHALELAERIGVRGLNVTAPFKTEMAEMLGKKGPASVNTVKMSRGSWRAVSTDEQGVLAALRRAGIEPCRALRAIVLGAGGAGLCTGRALVGAGAATVILNRDREKAMRVASLLGCEHGGLAELPERLLGADLLVSCLPRGVVPLKPGWLRPGLTVLDAEYAAGAVAALARGRGCRVIDGRDWLFFQAAAGFRFLTGRKAPPLEIFRRALRAENTAKPGLALVGLSGSGKSTLGRWLAEKLDADFFDLDAEIERRRGMKVADIFATDGEEAFRRLERAVLADLSRRKKTVVTCGGGAVLDEINRRRLKRNFWVTWLWAEPEVCAARLPAGSRPLLDDADRCASLRRQLRVRRLLYAECADLVLDATVKVEQVAERILNEVGFRAHG